MQFSDLHLSEARPHNVRNWERCLAAIERTAPDLVLVTGDIVLDDPDIEADQAFARAQLARIPAPWRAIPGNHDVGDTQPHPYQGQPVTQARRDRFVGHYGADHWAEDVGQWRLIGLNDMLFASDLPAEQEQFAWLDMRLAECAGRPVALFLHKPLCLDTLDETAVTQMAVTPEGRRRLLDRLSGSDVRLVGAGHTHRHRSMACGGLTMVWAPTTAQINEGFKMPRGGAQCVGWIEYVFRGDAVEWTLARAADLMPVDITALSARYGAMRFVPPDASSALAAQARVQPVA